MSSTKQVTFDGDEEPERERPDTFVVCDETGQFLLRMHRHSWPHSTTSVSEWRENKKEEEDPYDEFDADEEVGKWFDITLSYTIDYRFRVPAWSDHEAEELAKEWQLNADPADKYHVHTNKREVKSIERQDLPENWDPYSGERIYDALERMDTDENKED